MTQTVMRPSFFRDPFPITTRPTKHDLMAFGRAKSFRHWIKGWLYEWRGLPIHGVNPPLAFRLKKSVLAPNPIFAHFAAKKK